MSGPDDAKRMQAITGMQALLIQLEREALSVDLRTVARFLRLARLEIEELHDPAQAARSRS